MVLNGEVVVRVAILSAELCQYVAFNPERFTGRDALRLVCCIPLRAIGRLALSLCALFCLPSFSYYHLPRSFSSSSSSSTLSSSSSDADSDDLGGYVYDHSHSD